MSALPAASQPSLDVELAAFLRDLCWAEVPERVRRQVAWLLMDFASVCVAGRAAPAAAIAAEYASDVHGAGPATALLDGRNLNMPGAAWANGVLANVLDYDDGHRITKGHPGAMVIPAALAVAQAHRSTLKELLEAIVLGYEVAIRAGVRLHEREQQYHASGAWGALATAAVTARLLRLPPAAAVHAIGLAEYHAPIAPIMRSVADPGMTKDATGWGAFLGVGSAMLAARGYTALVPTFLTDGEPFDFLERWDILEVYVKPYPCCRWTQPAIEAALRARTSVPDPAAIQRVTIHTFKAAERLSRRRPATTEEMQYSLVWPVAVALADGDFGVREVLTEFADPAAAMLAERTGVVVDEEMTSAFPERRRARVVIELRAGEQLDSGVIEARGEPHDPSWEGVVEDKVRSHLRPDACSPLLRTLDPPDAVVEGDAGRLLALLTYSLGAAGVVEGG